MAPSNPLISPEEWRRLLRAILRECSYLPDPIARAYMHTHTIQRYRRYHNNKNNNSSSSKNNENLLQQSRLRRSALQRLSHLKRANEGYIRPLERTLYISYGRTGKRRRDLLQTFITTPPDIAPDTDAVSDLLKQPPMFEDGWQPPLIVKTLLRSQLENSILQQLVKGVRPVVRDLQPRIPIEDSWGRRPIARCRRVNIRKRWYQGVLESLLPPLPKGDLDILLGLMSGSIPWAPVKRRKMATSVGGDGDGKTVDEGEKYLTPTYLLKGPPKSHTFRPYTNGRPHKLTRRFMRRLWKRISCLVPRMSWNESAKEHRFLWDSFKYGSLSPSLPVFVPVGDSRTGGSGVVDFDEIFRGLDERGKLVRPV